MDSARNVKKPKRIMSDAQRKARLENLAAGRAKRKEMIQKKKEPKADEFDLSSDSDSVDSDSDSDNDAFVLSRKKKPVKSHARSKKSVVDDPMRREFDELKNIVVEIAKKQVKASKNAKQTKRSSGGTKIVVLPQNSSTPSPNILNNSEMDRLRKSLGM